ncbi:hypothetical protein ACFQDG_12585 [Natronoarchaeum mannanilyticum]
MRSNAGSESEAVFECLAEKRRRDVVAALRGRGAASLRELADSIADPNDRTERVELELHHRHLPKLADAGLAEYDPDDRTIEPSEGTAAADVVARTVEQCGALCPDAEPTRSDRARLE